MFRLSVMLIFMTMHGAAEAAPSVFLRSELGRAWWNTSNAEARVIGSSAGAVTTANLSKFIEATEIYGTYKICALSAVDAATYVGVDKAIQDEINLTLKTAQWRIETRTSNGIGVIAQSVLFEACDDIDNRGAAVLVTNAQTSQIMLFKPMGTFEPKPGMSKPIITAFLERPDARAPDPALFSFSSCTECGASTAVYYDVTRRKLYTEYNGH